MYYCEDCEHFFEVPDEDMEGSGALECCPYCTSEFITWKGDPE